MNEEDFASDDSDDSDFCPIEKSDSESLDEKDDLNEQDDDETSKTRTKKKKRGKIRTTKENSSNLEIDNSKTATVDPDEEKKREEELWAAFLGDSEPTQPSKSSTISTKSALVNIPKVQKSITPIVEAPVQSKIFEFAGEEIVLEEQQNVLQNTSQNSSSAKSAPSGAIKRPSGGGLSSVLSQISKKNKLSVLQKTKIDWDGFKSTEGINEELQTHNRGKDG